MLPPPTTRPSWAPVAWTPLSSSVRRSMTMKSIPEPPACCPAKASPEILRRARGYARVAANSAPPELVAHETPDLDFLARLAGQLLDELAHGALVVLHELLLEEDVVLVELLHH